ncbi:DUF1194 domain-containing protein [Aminobacter sp. DSM 101952]|uniref:DUF1194 domain-containing protein n=1 Tax=Aminobacter sp. DSM 101952 TaxID=2735891 RepID=UPI0017FD2D6C|nr:DUF1194 domain-containing protein [Aminobacter sp. DSM 101952]
MGALLARLTAVLAASACPAYATNVDTAIVFAVDVSASIDAATADMQRQGHADALVAPEVIAAIARGGSLGCIAITYFEWAGPGHVRTVLPWTAICSHGDAQAAAAIIRRDGDSGRGCIRNCSTSISFAIDLSGILFERYPGHAERKVIDISANGTNNDGLPVAFSRLRALRNGYTINAIAMPAHTRGVAEDLTDYFAKNVIGGPGAFVVSPDSVGDYADALRRKLVVEISSLAVAE